ARVSTIDLARAALALASGSAALSFLASVSTPGLFNGRLGDRAVAAVAVALILGIAGIVGQMVLLLSPGIDVPMWIGLGAFPLVNWNLPFGTLVGLSAITLGLVYWSMRVQTSKSDPLAALPDSLGEGLI
ncbi:MAG: hypothetical protein R3291_02145, partial [Thermoplasmata archaeon]|nr:hypothetical protein [Thermoplasmata archaeon]